MTLSATALERAASYALGYASTQEGGNYLPNRIALFTPIAIGKQSGFTGYDTPRTVTTFKEFFTLYGECPGAQIFRILKPTTGGGVGNIPVDVFPIEDAYGATAAVGAITPTGTAADAANTHYIKFNGRLTIEGRRCSYSVVVGDTPTTIIAKQIAAINAFLYSPVTASDGTTATTLTAKWNGKTGNKIVITVDTNGEDCGITYAVTNPTGAVGDPDVADALTNMGNVWYTHHINIWGSELFSTIETVNGRPDITTNGTGRWMGTMMKPFVSVYGSIESVPATLKALVASRKLDLTNALAPAPLSTGYEWEAAANMVVLSSVTANSNAHMDICGLAYPDMPAPLNDYIGAMQDWAVRDDLIDNGISTVTYNASEGYVVQSFITPRRPDDESPLAIDFRYVRDIFVDMNVAYNYKLLEGRYLLDKTVVNDSDVVTVDGVIKPKNWKSILFTMVDSLADLALLADRDYAKDNITVAISSTDPQRINTTFYYKRSGVARKHSTNAYAGFNFGG